MAQLGPSHCTQSLEGSIQVVKSVGVYYGQRSRSMLFGVVMCGVVWCGVVWCSLLLCCVCNTLSSLVIVLVFCSRILLQYEDLYFELFSSIGVVHKCTMSTFLVTTPHCFVQLTPDLPTL